MGEFMSKNRERKQKWIGKLIALFAGFLLGATGAETIFKTISSGNVIISVVINVILFLSAFVAQIIIHEGGHLIFGLLSGYKFISFRIGSFMILKTNDEVKLKRFSIMGTGGQCLMAPPDVIDESTPYILYNLGGSINNLISAILLFILSKYIDNTSYLNSFIYLSSIIGVVFAILNGVPIHGDVDNDGYNILNISKNIEAKKCFFNQLKINELVTKGIRLKDMSEEYFKIYDENYISNSFVVSQSVFACGRAIDNMDFKYAEEIGKYVLKHSEELIPVYKYMITLEMIFCELIGENRKEVIDLLYSKEVKKFEKISKDNISVLRIRYAYCIFYKDNLKEAEKVIDLFNRTAKKYPNKCEIESERELISYINELYKKDE